MSNLPTGHVIRSTCATIAPNFITCYMFLKRFQYGSNIIRTIVHIPLVRFMMACFCAVLFTTSHHHDRRRSPTADGECSTPRPRTSTGPPLEKVCHPGSPCPPRSHPRSCKSPQTAPSSHSQILAFLGGFYMHRLLTVFLQVEVNGY